MTMAWTMVLSAKISLEAGLWLAVGTEEGMGMREWVAGKKKSRDYDKAAATAATVKTSSPPASLFHYISRQRAERVRLF